MAPLEAVLKEKQIGHVALEGEIRSLSVCLLPVTGPSLAIEKRLRDADNEDFFVSWEAKICCYTATVSTYATLHAIAYLCYTGLINSHLREMFFHHMGKTKLNIILNSEVTDVLRKKRFVITVLRCLKNSDI